MDSGTTSFYRIVQIFSIEIIENNSERFSLPSSLFRTLSNSYDGAFCKNCERLLNFRYFHKSSKYAPAYQRSNLGVTLAIFNITTIFILECRPRPAFKAISLSKELILTKKLENVLKINTAATVFILTFVLVVWILPLNIYQPSVPIYGQCSNYIETFHPLMPTKRSTILKHSSFQIDLSCLTFHVWPFSGR